MPNGYYSKLTEVLGMLLNYHFHVNDEHIQYSYYTSLNTASRNIEIVFVLNFSEISLIVSSKLPR